MQSKSKDEFVIQSPSDDENSSPLIKRYLMQDDF